MKPRVLLLDIDGVLVAPLGYRAAVQAALAHTFRRWGWPLAPPDDLAEHYEAAGISSEWHMVPLALATALDAWSSTTSQVPSPAVLEPTGPSPGPWQGTKPDFAATPRRLAPHLTPNASPGETAWRLQGTPQAIFPSLGRSPLAQTLLTRTREPLIAPTTRLFQHFALGSATFARTYGRPAEIQTPSFLKQYDRALLPPVFAEWLCEARAQQRLFTAVFSARPSLPPRGTPPRVGYAPEAEMALEAIGCPNLPLIAFGRLQALAEEIGLPSADALLKPAPFHALAALLAALTGDEHQALRAAAAWQANQRHAKDILPTEGVHIIVVEDTTSGMQAALALQHRLREEGVPIELTLLGVATHPAKRRSLARLGAHLFPTTEDAFASLTENLA